MTLNLFPARVPFVDKDGKLTAEAWRALRVVQDDVNSVTAAANVTFVPAGDIVSTNVQAMGEELDTDIVSLSTSTSTGISSLSTGLSTTNSGLTSLSTSTSTGISSLSTGLSTTNSSLTSLSTSTSTGLSTATSSIVSLSSSASTGITSLSTGLSTTNSGLVSLSTSTSTGLSTHTSQITSLSTGLSTTNSTVTTLSTSASTGLSTHTSQITSLSTGLSTTNSNVTALSTSASTGIVGRQPLDSDLTSWALITRAAGYDTFATTPNSANFAALLTDEAGTAGVVPFQSNTTFTPTLTLGGAAVGMAFTTQVGDYYRIGNVVFYRIILVLSALGSSTGTAQVNGLPFTSQGQQTTASILVTGFVAGVGSSMIMADVNASATTIRLSKLASGSRADVTNADLGATARIQIAGWYPI